ncbi:MAG: hypothetical protein K5656_08695 [Lachnospiraceae bacterium]|nr:hypothetical protein [Lachnospiraceae bacterium]
MEGRTKVELSSLDKAIQVISTLAISGFCLDEVAKENLIAIANKEKTTDDVLKELDKKYGKS